MQSSCNDVLLLITWTGTNKVGTYGVICKLLCLRFLFAYFCSSRALYTCNLNYSIAVDYIKIGVKHVPHPHPKKKKVYWALVSRHMGVGDFCCARWHTLFRQQYLNTAVVGMAIDDLRKTRGLHSVSAYRHGLYIYRSMPVSYTHLTLPTMAVV